MWLSCPYLGRDVELTAERERHIRRQHPETLPRRRSDLVLALWEPDEVRRRSWRPGELLFVRHSAEGDIVVVVTFSSEPENDIDPPRTWVVTAYLSENAPLSEVLWIKP